jgi:ATP-binding cassette subfamily F protein 3
MHVIQIDNLTINHAGREIFKGLCWAVGERDRVGLVGPNGAGKSSLLKAIVGQVSPDSGTIVMPRGIKLGYMAQEVTLPLGQTLYEAALRLPPDLARVEAELAAIEAQFGTVASDPGALSRLLDRQEKTLAAYHALEGDRHESRVREYLAHLGLTPDQFDVPVGLLSGGQKKLVALIQLVIEKPDVLLLDEPDNHLDLEAKRALESFITGYAGAVVLISHDRYLLDGTVTQIAELADGKLALYKGNYTAFKTQQELARLRQEQLYTAQQKEIARIQAAIARFEHWASIVVDERHIRQARSRQRMLDRMEENGEIIEKVRPQRTMALQLEGWRGSTKILDLKNLAMGFGDDLLFMDMNLTLRHGERVGLIGDNGAGKSVLFKLILGELTPIDGEIRIGPSVKIGYYAQEHQTLTDWLHRTPIERIRDIRPMTEGEAVAILGKFLFSYAHTRQAIGTLSGGERSRLQLACLMLSKPNLLLLDEPTNNLDIPSVEALEAAIENFEGAILVISHDRYFLDQAVDRVFVLQDGLGKLYEGGYTDYLQA